MIQVVIDHLWQSTVFVLLAGLLTLALRKNRASVRFNVWLAASAKFLLPLPLLVIAGQQLHWQTTSTTEPAPRWSVILDHLAEPGLMLPPRTSPNPALVTPQTSIEIVDSTPTPSRPATVSLPSIAASPMPSSFNFRMPLGIAWACGVVVLLLARTIQWLEIRSVVKAASCLPIKAPIPVMSTLSTLEPGLFGIVRPVILLPEGIGDALDSTQMAAILDHELCHWRRRDNLTAAIHMIVEALFWFHPLVWWLGARLMAERERACDEAVVQSGRNRHDYAEGLLKVCKLYIGGPPLNLAGVSGGNLTRRVEVIMTHRVLNPLPLTKKFLLLAAGCLAIAGPVVVGLSISPPAFAVAVTDSGVAPVPVGDTSIADSVESAAVIAAPPTPLPGGPAVSLRKSAASRASARAASVVPTNDIAPKIAADILQPPDKVVPSSVPLPVEKFAEIPVAQAARMSPDGTKLAVIGAVDGHPAIIIKSLHGSEKVMDLGRYQAAWVYWKSDRRLIAGLYASTKLYSRALPQREQILTRLAAFDSDGSNIVRLAAHTVSRCQGVAKFDDLYDLQGAVSDRDSVANFLIDDPRHVLLAGGGITRIDIDTCEQIDQLVREGLHIHHYLIEPNGQTRLGMGLEGTDEVVFVRDDIDSTWRLVHRHNVNGTVTFTPLAFIPDHPDLLYVVGTDPKSGAYGLWAFNTTTRAFDHLIDPDVADAAQPEILDGRLVSYLDRNFMRRYVDPTWEKDAQTVQKALPGRMVEIIDRPGDGAHVLFRVADFHQPNTWWILDRTANPSHLTAAVETYPDLIRAGVAPVEYVSYAARDGLRIPAYLTLPAGRRDAPIPFVVLPHRGPNACDSGGFNYEAQFLASRGWGVLQPEYRGSSCFGPAFEQRGYQEWGYAMQDDLTDGTRWLVDQKLADPGRICIVGSGYGGYAALEGAIKEPGLYRCAAAWAPITDLTYHRLEEIRTHPNWLHDVSLDRLGQDTDRLAAVSPVRHADRIEVPVLLMHGRGDSDVQVEYTEWMEQALHSADKPVETIYLDNADHFRKEYPARLAWLQALERFLGANLSRSVRTAAAE